MSLVYKALIAFGIFIIFTIASTYAESGSFGVDVKEEMRR